MKTKVLIAAFCVLFLFIAVGCAAPAQESSSASIAEEAPQAAPAATSAPVLGAMDSGAGETERTLEESGAGYAGDEAATEEPAGSIGALPNANIPDTGRKLVYSAYFQMESKQFDNDYTEIKKALAGVGGYVESENTYDDKNEYGSARYSTMILRVPVDSYNDFLDTISGIGTVRDKQITTEDISDQYFDTEARIEILENRYDRLMNHLASATRMEDIIALEAELSDVLYELDSYKGSKRGMDDLVEFTRVTIDLNEVISAETITATGDPLGERAANAYELSMTGVGQFLQDFAVGFAAAAPVLLLLAVIAVIIFAIYKLCRYLRRRWITKHGEKPKRQKSPFYPGGFVNGQPPQGYQNPVQSGMQAPQSQNNTPRNEMEPPHEK
ncbi:MAG TPA: hypothetical protein DEB31_06940 [Clostridiales bacterium]|nr:hypothetical protein [Clostridiales bacterium]